MAGGHVDRNVLASKFQNYGDTYDDTKTESAMEVLAQQNDDNWDAQVAHKTAAVLDHPDGSVTTAKIAQKAITAPLIATGAINSQHIDAALLASAASLSTQAEFDKRGVNVQRFGAIGDGNSHPLLEKFPTLAAAQAVYPHAVALTDEIDWCSIQAAHNSAGNGYVYIPGTFTVNRSINYKKPMKGSSKVESVIKSSITDGSPVISIDSVDNWELTTFVIDGQSKNCVGIKAFNTSSWYHLSKVDVRNCGLDGFDLEGWGGFIDNCHALSNSGNGWILRQANGLKANLKADANGGTGIVVKDGGGIDLVSPLSEGNSQGGINVESGVGVTLINPYLESNFSYQAKFGNAAGTVENLTILGGSIVNSNAGNLYGVYLDKVNSAEIINCKINDYNSKQPIVTTTNAKNVKISGRSTGGTAHVKDLGTSLFKKKFNYFPNPIFDKWLAGYQQISLGNGSISLENTLVRNGKNAIRFTNTSGAVEGSMQFVLPANVVDALKGKTVVIGMWVYIPDSFVAPNMPRIALTAAVSGTAPSNFANMTKGGWHFITTHDNPLTILNSETGINASFFTGSTVLNEFLVIDSAIIAEYSEVDAHEMMTISYPSHPTCAVVKRYNIEIYGTAPPTNTSAWRSQQFNVGDTMINTSPANGGFIGWVCVTDGVIGTSAGTWKPFGSIRETAIGTATINAASSTVVVNHGLSAAPANVTATPQGNVGAWWITAITTTQFTINCTTAPAGNTVVSWEAKI